MSFAYFRPPSWLARKRREEKLRADSGRNTDAGGAVSEIGNRKSEIGNPNTPSAEPQSAGQGGDDQRTEAGAFKTPAVSASPEMAALSNAECGMRNAEQPAQRVCSWCKTILAPGSLPATHGICPGCFVRFSAQINLLNECDELIAQR